MPDTTIQPTYFWATNARIEAKSDRKEQLETLVAELILADAATFKAKKPELDRLAKAVVEDDADSRRVTARANEERARRGEGPYYGYGAFLTSTRNGDIRGSVEKQLETVEAQLDTAGDLEAAFDLLRQRNQLKAMARSLSQL
jgi:hypothetical protein